MGGFIILERQRVHVKDKVIAELTDDDWTGHEVFILEPRLHDQEVIEPRPTVLRSTLKRAVQDGTAMAWIGLTTGWSFLWTTKTYHIHYFEWEELHVDANSPS